MQILTDTDSIANLDTGHNQRELRAKFYADIYNESQESLE